MSQQPEALRLADLCDTGALINAEWDDVSAELRRLHAVELEAIALRAQVERLQAAGPDKVIDDLISQRDHRDEIIDSLCDAVLGDDRAEWSSAYYFEDAIVEVQERIAELETRAECVESNKPATPPPSPTPAQEDADTGADERALFEFSERASDLTRNEDEPDEYRNQFVQSCWDGWQKRAALAARAGQVAAPAMVPLQPLSKGDMERVWYQEEGVRHGYGPLMNKAIAEFCRINGLTVGGSNGGGDK